MLVAAPLNGTSSIQCVTSLWLAAHVKINYLTVWKLHDHSSQNAQTYLSAHNHTPHTDTRRIYDWALLQRIQMKQFSHLIHSHSLFILLGETEALGFSSQWDPGTPSILMSKGNAMHYSGVNHQGVKTKVGSASELKWTTGRIVITNNYK